MSNSFFLDKKYDKAVSFAHKAVDLSRETSFQVGLYRSLNQLGKSYLANNEPKKALVAVEKALKVEVKDPAYERNVLYNYSQALMANQKYETARINIHKTIQQFYQNPQTKTDKMLLQDNYFRLSKAYTFLRIPDSADFFLEKARDLYKQTEMDKVIEATTEIQTQYETEKKEQKIIQLTQKNQIKELELQNSYYLIGIFVLFGLSVTVVIWLFFRQKSIVDEFEKEQAQLRWRRAQLNPHFFFNVLSALQMLMYEQKNKEAVKYMAGFSVLMRKVLEESNKEKTTLEEEIEFLEEYLSLEKLSLDFEYTFEVPDDLEVEDILIPTMLLQPFVENAIEHGLRKSTKEQKQLLIIFTEINEQSLQISVRDNGAGRTEERRKNHISRASSITKNRQKLMKNSFEYKIIDHKDMNNQSLGTEVIFTITI